MTWGSRAPLALAALVAKMTAALPGIVRDGPVVSSSGASEALVIGYINDTTAGIEHQFGFAEASAGQNRERFTIHSAIIVVDGGERIAVARTRAYEILGLVGGVLATDPTLGSSVMMARLGEAAFTPKQTAGQGAVGTLIFGVTCDAFTSH